MIKKDEMEKACSPHTNYTKYWSENFKARDHLGDLGKDETDPMKVLEIISVMAGLK
jgi:hypothetical protein